MRMAIIRLSAEKDDGLLVQPRINLAHKKKRIKTEGGLFPISPTRPSFDQIESDAITKDTKEWQSCRRRHASRRLSEET